MHLASFVYQSETLIGPVVGGKVIPIEQLGRFPTSMLELIAAGPQTWHELKQAVATTPDGLIALEEVKLLAPLPKLRKNVMCLGWNYSEHANESARADKTVAQLPEFPIVFTKAPTTVNGPYGTIPYNETVSTQIDWEVELGVIIGLPGRGIAPEHALEHVFGYTVINDVTARDLQRQHRQFFLGKSLDGACPMGPWIVTSDEISDPQSLRLASRVNGVEKQNGTTADQIFDVATTVSILSRSMTLEAGDVIATGTPDGVGFARTPPEFLKPGDVVECEVEGIGILRNQIVAQ